MNQTLAAAVIRIRDNLVSFFHPAYVATPRRQEIVCRARRLPLPILDIEEFHVAPGEQMVLVGKSGCGKTTLLHVIAGITRPDCGKVRINDWDITLMPEAECDRFRAEHIGYVFQTFNLLRGFSALENVMLAMRFARLPSENAGPLAQWRPSCWTWLRAAAGR